MTRKRCASAMPEFVPAGLERVAQADAQGREPAPADRAIVEAYLSTQDGQAEVLAPPS